jgi:hypothetical protein
MAIQEHDDGRTLKLTGHELEEYIEKRFKRFPDNEHIEHKDEHGNDTIEENHD